MTDSIIQEIRNVSEQHTASMGYDLDKIYADLRSKQEKRAAEGGVIVSPPSNPPLKPGMALQRTRFAPR